MSKQALTDESRVYVACLGCYNDGTLRGTHMTAEQLSDAWHEGLASSVCDEPNHDEWAIHDYDGDIARCGLGEHPDIEGLIALMETIDSDPATMVAAFMLADDLLGSIPTAEQVEQVAERMEVIEDRAEWAEETMGDCGMVPRDLPGVIASNINWDAIGQEILTHDYHTIEYGYYTYALHVGEEVDA